MDIRAENPVQSEPEMLDLVPYGPPLREQGCQFLNVFLMGYWLLVFHGQDVCQNLLDLV